MNFRRESAFPFLGHGVGLRLPHYGRALAGALEVDWVEVVSENFFGGGGRPRAVLEAVRRDRPLVFHGVSLGVGSLGAPDSSYLRRLRALASDFEPAWISDHVCWTRFAGRESHELLPLPFTEEALAVAVDNTQRAQDALGRPLVLENVSSYVQHAANQLTEWEFLAELAARSGCSLLLDLNNVVVSAFNHGFSPDDYLAGLPPGKVVQFHLANHSQYPHHKFDDHRGPVPEVVWALYEEALRRFGPVSSLVEWDEDIRAWEQLVAERDEAQRRAERVLGAARPRGQVPPGTTPAGSLVGQTRSPRRVSTDAGPLASVALAARAAASPAAPELEASQRLLMAALTWPHGVGDWAASDPSARSELRQRLRAGDGDPIERLELYADAYFYRQLDALRSAFPRLARLAGDVAFHDLVTGYVLDCPSRDPDLHQRGDRLPAFLRAHPLGREKPLLGDLAELELALAGALDAPDAEALSRIDLARLAAEDWTGLELALVPCARLVRASYDLERAARLCDAGELAAALEAPRIDTGPSEPGGPRAVSALVFRRGQRVCFRVLEPLEGLALARISEGARFDAVCDRLGAHGVEPAAILAWLERWLDDGLLRKPRER